MKEGKKKTTARKKVSSSSASKRVVPKNQTPKMPEHRNEPPKVKKIDVEEINKDFDDGESEDKRLIVFIAIAILVIVGTIIGLLVGCEKKENNTPEPEKPNTDVVVPEKPDEKGDEEDGVKTKEVIRKVTAVYTSNKKSNSGKKDDGKKDDKKDKVTYSVTFYLGEESETVKVESGKTTSGYVPTGYSACTYYKDSNLEEEFDITAPITENVNVYMDCGEPIEYDVVYESVIDGVIITTTNPATYTVKDDGTLTDNNPVITLSEPILSARKNMISDEEEKPLYFDGWFKDKALTKSISALTKELLEDLDLAHKKGTIHIYAKLTEEKPEETPDDPTSGDEPGDTPSDPEAGDTPSDPEAGDTPSDPEAGDTPSDPEAGDTPSDPEAGDTPSDPEVGDTPSDPEVGDTPSDPEPQKPSNPTTEISSDPKPDTPSNTTSETSSDPEPNSSSESEPQKPSNPTKDTPSEPEPKAPSESKTVHTPAPKVTHTPEPVETHEVHEEPSAKAVEEVEVVPEEIVE